VEKQAGIACIVNMLHHAVWAGNDGEKAGIG